MAATQVPLHPSLGLSHAVVIEHRPFGLQSGTRRAGYRFGGHTSTGTAFQASALHRSAFALTAAAACTARWWGSADRTHTSRGSREGRASFVPLAAERRAGDLGEKAGESYFPQTAEQVVQATGESIPSEPPMRIGHGYDIHRMLPRDSTDGWGKCAPQPAVIGGVTFDDFPLGVVAHSDGDVAYHSTTDAILGALGLPDIGQLFPDNDPRWRGANSEQFFDEAVRLMELRGYRISNIDVTIIAEKPRLAPVKKRMQENIVRICHTIPARVNIKARTHEKLDSVGECRAIECHVCILLERSHAASSSASSTVTTTTVTRH